MQGLGMQGTLELGKKGAAQIHYLDDALGVWTLSRHGAGNECTDSWD